MASTIAGSPLDLSTVRWKGEEAFRALSYYFTVRWNSDRLGRPIRHVLGVFAVPPDPSERRSSPTPGLPPSYSAVDLGPKDERRYRIFFGDGLLISTDDKDNLLNLLFWHINNEAFWQTGDFLLLHAGSVVSPAGHGILMPGQAGSGKTTLTAGLVRAGFGYLSDEGGVIDPVTRRLYPYPKTLNLKAGSFHLFSHLEAGNGKPLRILGRWYLRPDDIRPGAIGRPCELRLVVVPRYQEGAALEATPMTGAETIREIWDSVWGLHHYGFRALHLLAQVMHVAEGHRLVFGDLDQAVKAVTDLADRARQ
jgi:hypothetical protein